MTDTSIPATLSPSTLRGDPPTLQHCVLLSRLFFTMAALTLVLMALGSATRVMNAGLACPDWPLCYGTMVPTQQMTLQVFLEWFHRLIASTLGVLMIALTGFTWWRRRQSPSWVPIAAIACLGLVILQGILGGLTVTQLLRFDIVTAHLATGLLFFSSLLAIGSVLIPYQGTGVVGKLPVVGWVAVGCVYAQSILGGLVASRWAVHQCLGGGRLCQVMNSHLLGVIPATVSVLVLALLVWRTAALHPYLRRLAQWATGLVTLQSLVGLATLKLHLQVEWLTVTHQATGAMLLGTLVMFSVMALRERRRTQPIPLIADSTETVQTQRG